MWVACSVCSSTHRQGVKHVRKKRLLTAWNALIPERKQAKIIANREKQFRLQKIHSKMQWSEIYLCCFFVFLLGHTWLHVVKLHTLHTV